MTEKRRVYLQLTKTPKTPAAIGKTVGLTATRTAKILQQLVKEGKAVHKPKGYVLGTGVPPKPPPTPPPPIPPKPKPSWTLTNGPWIFVESDPGSCPAGPWTRLDILENEITAGAPLWYCNQGKVPQAEGGNQAQATLDWIKQNPGGSIAPVTTLGIPVQPYLDLGVTSCMVEVYLQAQSNARDKMWSAGQEGWADPIPVIGVDFADKEGTFTFTDYLPWLRQYGSRFGVYASDPMQASTWDAIRAYLAAL